MKRILYTMMLMMLAVMTASAEKITSGGIEREMLVYAPANLPADRPLLISMHGMNQDMYFQRDAAKYEDVADTAKFVVVYPNGIDKGWDLGGMKDVNFILDIITEMSKRYNIDESRVYLSGFSMGGMMTYYAMTKIADRIAAFAPVSGYNMGGPNATSSRPIPILHVHGTGDDVCVYDPVMTHVKAWAQRNGCNMTPEVITPYPKGTGSNATMYRYKNGLDGVEVAHISMPYKGHWHSNDPAVVMTNKEIWNFCSRWSLKVGPKVLSISPENKSFDMTVENNKTFTITFDKRADCSKLKAGFIKPDGKVAFSIVPNETGFQKVVSFTIPAGKNLADATYTFRLVNIYDEEGVKNQNRDFTYTYGIKPVGDEVKLETIFVQDWLSQQSTIGEGCPIGWTRVHGDQKATSGQANTGGARMKYFDAGSEMLAGFYLCAREHSNVTLTYGNNGSYPLKLKAGDYRVSFRSSYWTAATQEAKNTFTFSVKKAADNSDVYVSPGLHSSGCQENGQNMLVKGSMEHVLDFTIPSDGNYLLEYSMAAGWNAVIVGQPTITTAPGQVEEYKGNFYRTYLAAKKMLAQVEAANINGYATQKTALAKAVTDYDGYFTVQPSDYTKAITALNNAMKPFASMKLPEVEGPTAADVVESNATAKRYTIYGVDGIQRPALKAGINILKAEDGKTITVIR